MTTDALHCTPAAFIRDDSPNFSKMSIKNDKKIIAQNASFFLFLLEKEKEHVGSSVGACDKLNINCSLNNMDNNFIIYQKYDEWPRMETYNNGLNYIIQ